MKRCAGGHRPHYGEKRPREPRYEAVGDQHQCHQSRRQAKSRDVRLRQLSHDLQQLFDRICAVHFQLEHVAEDGNSDLESDTGKEGDQGRYPLYSVSTRNGKGTGSRKSRG